MEGHGGTLSKFSLKIVKNFPRHLWKIICFLISLYSPLSHGIWILVRHPSVETLVFSEHSDHLSIMSGPFLASIAGSILCLIPIHNVLEKPEYWYQEIICRVSAGGILHISQILIRTEYWSNFVFVKRMKTYILFIGLHLVLLYGVSLVFYYYWSIWIGAFFPMPLNHLACGSIALIVMTILTLFRYDHWSNQ